MEKGNIYKIIVIALIIAIFIGEYALNIITKRGTHTLETGEEFKGIAYGKVRITDYNQNLVSQDIINKKEIENISGIERVTVIANSTLIKVNSTDEVPYVYHALTERGYVVGAKATLVPVDGFDLENGKHANITQSIQTYIPPIAPIGSVIEIKMYAYIKGNNLLGVGGISIVGSEKEISVKGRIVDKEDSGYKYIFNFERRQLIKEIVNYVKENVSYRINNIVYPKSTIGLQNISYVKYVGDTYVIVEDNFTNTSKIIEDMGESTFSKSYIISKNDLSELLRELNITPDDVKHTYDYKIEIDDDKYVITSGYLDYKTAENFDVNSSVIVSGNASMTGDVIVVMNISNVELS